MWAGRFWMLALAVGGMASACSLADSTSPGTPEKQVERRQVVEKIEAAHLPNAYRIHEKVLSGGMPEGDAAFRELQQLGIKTIISVDGAKPDVATARKFGLRYVHLPHGYDGISQERAVELAKAVRDLAGPIYIHCHHGKHRSPTAATVACVGAGFLSPENAHSILQTAGTSDHYRGLYDSAEHARQFEDQVLDALRVEFREVAPLPPLAESMVEIEKTFDRIKQIEKSGWLSPVDHPDLNPPHEALLLREHFTELQRMDDVKQRPERFRELLNDSLAAAEDLEEILRQPNAAGTIVERTASAGLALGRISKNCTACHQQYRDVPRENAQRSRPAVRP